MRPSSSGSPTASSPACAARSEDDIRALRAGYDMSVVFKTVDTCAAEFEAHTPYLYSTYDEEDEAAPRTRKKS